MFIYRSEFDHNFSCLSDRARKNPSNGKENGGADGTITFESHELTYNTLYVLCLLIKKKPHDLFTVE